MPKNVTFLNSTNQNKGVSNLDLATGWILTKYTTSIYELLPGSINEIALEKGCSGKGKGE